MKISLLALISCCLPLAAQLKDAGPRYLGSYTVATLPAAASYSEFVAVVTDAATAGSCTSGGGSAQSLCRSNGSAWISLGGGGATSVAGLTDLLATRTSGTVVAVAAGNQVIGNTSTPILAQTITFTGGSGNGTCFVYVTEGAAPVAECPTSAGLTGTFLPSGVFQSATTPAVPANSRYLADIIVVGGAVTSVVDRRGLGPTRPLFAGDGIVVTDVGGVATIARDPASVPCYGCTNPFTALVDVSAGILTQPFGSGTPSAGSCDAVGEVGRIYIDYAIGGLAYDCMQTGSGTYSWVSRGGAMVVPGAGTEIQYRSSGTALAALANSSVPNSGEFALSTTPNASATRAVLRLGNALASGNANGAYLGVNSAASYTGDYFNFQENGVDRFTFTLTSTIPRLLIRGANSPAGAYALRSSGGNYSFMAMSNTLGLQFGHNATGAVNTNYSMQMPREGGMQWLTPLAAKPTCAVGVRGTVWYIPGGAGVADVWERCQKDAADAYAWVAF